MIYGVNRDVDGWYLECVNTWTNAEYARIYLNEVQPSTPMIKGLTGFTIDFNDAFPDIVHLDATSKKAWSYCKEKGYIKGTEQGNAEPGRKITDEEMRIVFLDRMKGLTRNQVINMIYNLKI